MGTTTQSRLTLIELANRTLNGQLIDIAETLTEENDILKDAVWVEANQTTSHVHTRRLSIAYGSYRLINQGVDKEVTHTKQITEDIGMIEARSEIDIKLVNMAPDKIGFRQSEDKGFIEGMSQTFADAFFYGNRALHPERINGLALRMPSLSTSAAPYVLNQSGSGSDLTSLYMVMWGQDKVHFIYPRGSETMGINARDLGEMTVYDANSKPFQAYVTLFNFDIGIAVHDDKCIGRLANIETSGTSNIWTPEKTNELKNRMKNRGKGGVIYLNSTLLTQIENDTMDKSNVIYPVQTPYGDTVTGFKGMPFRMCDAILDTETALT